MQTSHHDGRPLIAETLGERISLGDLSGPPNEEGIADMKKELQRIDALPPHKLSDWPTNVPVNECKTLLQYKEAVIEAYTLAISEAERNQRIREEL